MSVAYEPLSDLVFVYMNGCAACEEAMPEVDKYATANPRVMVVKIQANGPFVERLVGKRIKATPTYVFRRAGEGFTREGMMSAKEIEQWIKAITSPEEDEE